MNILLLTDSDAFAGTEQHMLTLAVALQNQDQMVYVGSPSGSPLAVKCCDAAITITNIEKNGAIDVKAVLDLVRFVNQNHIDIVHAHNGRTALIARLVKLLSPTIKVVFTQHFIAPSSASRSGLLKLVSNAVHSFMAAGLDHTICVSTAVREAIELRNDAYSRCSTSVVWNGIETTHLKVPSDEEVQNLRDELQIRPSAKVILSASRLEPEKSVDLILKAFSIISRDNPSVILVIAGTGSEVERLKNLVAQLEITPKVRLVGFRTDVSSLMYMADVFVIASGAEPFGLSILESMSCGTPVIAANSGGPKEIIKDGETGYLFVPGDVNDLRAAINRCLNLESVIDLTDRAKQDVSIKFSASRMASDTLKVYALCTTRTERT